MTTSGNSDTRENKVENQKANLIFSLDISVNKIENYTQKSKLSNLCYYQQFTTVSGSENFLGHRDQLVCRTGLCQGHSLELGC